MFRRSALFASVVAVIACRPAPEVALPVTVTHPTYGVRAQVPDDWIAEASRDTVIPVDTWTLHPRGQQTPIVYFLLAFTPRQNRHSATFPGDRLDDSHRATKIIAGAPRAGVAENRDMSFMADFDVGTIAVSVRSYTTNPGDVPTLDAILAHVAFDPVAR